MNRLNLIFWIMLIGCLTGCVSLPEEGSADHAVFMRQCTQCHSWPHPGRHNKDEWDGILAWMDSIMQERNVKFSSEDKTTIRAYLHRNAR